MLCRVEMPTNEQIFGRFYRYRMLHNKGGQGGGRGILLLSLLLLIGAVFGFFTGIIWWMPVLMIVLAAAFFIYSFYIKPSNIFKQKSGVAMQTEVYLFSDTGFTCSIRNEEGGLPENTSCRYDALKEGIETKQDFYLIVGAKQVYCIDKEYFTNGTPEELSACLKKVLGDKFKKKG